MKPIAPNVKDGVVLLDEPELHLHPRWQRVFLGVFREIAPSRNNQFVITTHSPVFVSRRSDPRDRRNRPHASRRRLGRARCSSRATARGPAEAGHHDSGLQIELKGNLAAMLTMATRLRARESGGATAGFGPDFAGPQSATRPPETGDLELQIAMVAGGGFEPPTFGL